MSRNIQRSRRLWVAGTAITTLGAVAAAAITLRSEPASANAAPVLTATLQASEVNTWDEFSGRLEAVEHVDIRSRVAGTVQAVHFREGALVAKGELLITIDPAPYAADLERAEAQVVAAQARLAFTNSELERARRLLEEHAIAQREFDERQNAQREANANLRAAQASALTARLSMGYTQVRAPIAGRVGKLEITVGNLVAAGPGAPVLTTLVSMSPIYASFDADEQLITKALQTLPSGASARAHLERIPVQMGTAASSDTPYAGHLQLVDNQVDVKSGTVRVRAVFDNKEGTLMPGQFARLRMGQLKSSQALLINERAVGTDQNKKFVMVVGTDQNKKFVMVVGTDNTAAYREVTLGAQVGGLRIVSSGLKPQERVVVNGLQRIRPGALVQPLPVDMELKAAANQTAGASGAAGVKS
jgi:multidrug efflux system membrane fusion protein